MTPLTSPVNATSTPSEAQPYLFQSRLSLLLAAAAAVLALATAYTSIHWVVKYFSPVPYWDQWSVLTMIFQRHGHLGLADFWSQHNEHRIVIQRLLSLVDIFWFHGKSISLLIEMQLVQLAHLALLIYLCRRLAGLRSTSLLFASAFLAFCLYSPLQMENFDWGFQVAFVLIAFFGSLCVGLFVLHTQAPAGSRASRNLFAASIVVAALAEITNSNGVLLWPLLVVLCIAHGLPKRKWAAVAIAGAVAIGLYLIGYHAPGHHSNPLDSIRHPGQLLKYIITCLSFSWDAQVPNPSRAPVVAESASFLAICFVLCLLLALWRKRLRNAPPIFAFVAGNALFCLGTATLAATGRIRFGYQQATVSRYQSFALLFWGSVVIALLTLMQKQSWRTRLAVQFLLFVVLLATPARWPTLRNEVVAHKMALDRGGNAMLAGDFFSPALDGIYPFGPRTPSLYPNFLAYGFLTPLPSLNAVPSEVVSSCKGYVDLDKPASSGERTTSGWAFNTQNDSGAARVFLAGADGLAVASTHTEVSRLDVSQADRSVTNTATGWTVTWRPPHPGVYHAYAVITDHSACLITGQITVPEPAPVTTASSHP